MTGLKARKNIDDKSLYIHGTVRETGNDAWFCVFFIESAGHTRESGKGNALTQVVQSPLV